MVCLEIHCGSGVDIDDPLAIFTVTEAGMVARSGMNSEGLAVTTNSLFSTIDSLPFPGNTCIPSACFQRCLLECRSVSYARALCQTIPRHKSTSVLISDAKGRSVSLELGPRHVFTHHGQHDGTTELHTNHFDSFEAFQARRKIRDRNPGGSSRFRLSRLGHLIAARGRQGVIGAQCIRDMFSDHEGAPGSICQHAGAAGDDMTVLFVMYNLSRRLISVCKGPPCQGRMMELTFDSDDKESKKSRFSVEDDDDGKGGGASDQGSDDDSDKPRSYQPKPIRIFRVYTQNVEDEAEIDVEHVERVDERRGSTDHDRMVDNMDTAVSDSEDTGCPGGPRGSGAAQTVARQDGREARAGISTPQAPSLFDEFYTDAVDSMRLASLLATQ